MPLDELRSYQGHNPRPADFDAYWDRALSDLDATPPALELAPHPNPARFAECFDLWFTGVGGARVHAQYLRPRSEGRIRRSSVFTGTGTWPATPMRR